MMKRNVFFGLLFFSMALPLQASEVAYAILASGDVEVKRSARHVVELSATDRLLLNDQVISGEQGVAKLLLKGSSIVQLAADTKLVLDTVSVRDDAQNTVLKQDQGLLRVSLGKKLKPRSSFEVHTPAAVVGIKQGLFDSWVGPEGLTIIRCLQGRVEVRGIHSGLSEPILVQAGQYTVIPKGARPSLAVALKRSDTIDDVLLDLGMKISLNHAQSEAVFAGLAQRERTIFDNVQTVKTNLITDMRTHSRILEDEIKGGSSVRKMTEKMNNREISERQNTALSEPLILPEAGSLALPIAIEFPSL